MNATSSTYQRFVYDPSASSYGSIDIDGDAPVIRAYLVKENGSGVLVGSDAWSIRDGRFIITDLISFNEDYGTGYAWLFLERNTPLVQTATFQNGRYLDVRKVEAALDNLSKQIQDLSGRQDGTVQVPLAEKGDEPVRLPSVEARKGMILGFDADGNFTTPYTLDELHGELEAVRTAKTATEALVGVAKEHSDNADLQASNAAESYRLASLEASRAESERIHAEAAGNASHGAQLEAEKALAEARKQVGLAAAEVPKAKEYSDLALVHANKSAEEAERAEDAKAVAVSVAASAEQRVENAKQELMDDLDTRWNNQYLPGISSIRNETITAKNAAIQAQGMAEVAASLAASSKDTAQNVVASFDGRVETALSGVDAKKTEALEILDAKKTEIEGVYQEDLSNLEGRLTSSLTDLENDTYRKAEVDSKVAEATPADYDSVKRRVVDLEYENRITKAVLAKKIAEETEATGTVIPFPSTGEDGYPLAEWGLLKRLKGESLVWNQLVDTMYAYARVDRIGKNSDGTFDITTSAQPSTTIASQVAFDTKITKDHVYLPAFAIKTNANLLSGVSIAIMDKSNYSVLQRGSNYNPIKATAEGNYMVIFQLFRSDYTSSVTIRVSSAFVDLTYLFGVTEAHQVTDWMKAWVRAYAEAHPQYDGGSLLSSRNVQVKSVGANIFDGEWTIGYVTGGAFVDNPSFAYSNPIKVEVGEDYTIIPFEQNKYELSYYTCDSNGVITGNSVGSTAINYRTVQPTTSVIRLRVKRADNGNFDKATKLCFKKGTDTTYVPQSSQIVEIPSSWYSVSDIGIEGTVIDFEKETVTWTRNYVADISDRAWGGSAGSWAFAFGGMKPCAINEVAKIIFSNGSYQLKSSNSDSGVSGSNDAYVNTNGRLTIRSNDKPSGEMVYELATPITKTFSELGIVIPKSWDGGKPWIRVEAGGKFTVVSSGAPAEATVSFVTDLRRA